MTTKKHYLITALTVLAMSFACTPAAYAEETANTESAETTTITAGEYRRRMEAESAEENTAEIEIEVPEEENTNQEAQIRSLGIFRTTAYCPCYGCSEGYGRHTSTGAIAKANHTIAVDPRVIPYGSKVIINGTVYTAEDRGGGVKGNHIDIFYDTHAQTRQYGSRQVEIFLIG